MLPFRSEVIPLHLSCYRSHNTEAHSVLEDSKVMFGEDTFST